MATIQIELPDQLAEKAQSAGLLSSEAIEEILQQQLRAESLQQLMEAARRIDTVNDGEPITPGVAAEEIAAMRAERRAVSRTS